MSEIRKDYDEQGNWIGATVTQEITKTEAVVLREKLNALFEAAFMEEIERSTSEQK